MAGVPIKEITIGQADGKSVTFKVAPTPLYRMAECGAMAADAGSPEGVRAMLTGVFYGARRAGSEITLDWLLDNVDLHNQDEILAVFVELNKLAPQPPLGPVNEVK